MPARLRNQYVKASQKLQRLLAQSRLEASRSAITDEAIASLRSEGVFVSTVERLLGAAAPAYREAMAEAVALLQGPQQGAGVTWLARGASSDLAPGDLLAHVPALFLFGLNATMLSVAEQYLRLPVAYHGAVLRRSLVDGNEVGPRLWHRDWEDYHVLRSVVYLNDVDEDGGPFEYVPRSLATADAKAASSAGRRSDAEMAALIPRERWKRCVGPAGTVVLADSAQVFHHESLQRSRERAVVMMGHASRLPMNRGLAESHFPVHQHLPALARITRPEHHAHVFGWRDLATPVPSGPSGTPRPETPSSADRRPQGDAAAPARLDSYRHIAAAAATLSDSSPPG